MWQQILAAPDSSVPVPSVVTPSLNVIVPVAVDGTTLAVNVTFAPNVAGFNDDVSEVVVVVWFTTCATPDEVLVEKLVSPP